MNNEAVQVDSENIVGFSINCDAKKLQLTVPRFLTQGEWQGNIDKKEYFLFYRLFKKYERQNVKQRSVKEEGHFQNTDSEMPANALPYDFSVIELFFTLWEDYDQNGLLLFSEKDINAKPKGNINWRKNQSPGNEIFQDNTPFYRQLYYNNLNFNYRHPVTMLHACCLFKVMGSLGIKINLPYDYDYLIAFENFNYAPMILKKYKREMFSDRSRKIFGILEKMYVEKSLISYTCTNGRKLQYAEKFDAIWEKMLQSVLGNNPKLKESLPHGRYCLHGIGEKQGLEHKPDILIESFWQDERFLLVLDAKNYILENNVPQTDDITKQIFYKLFLSKEFNPSNSYHLKNIVNAFIFPKDLSQQNMKIMYLGKHSFDNELHKDKDIGVILCFYVDFYWLRNEYLKSVSSGGDKLRDYIIQEYIKELAK